jgi:membrane-associated phospholipid phosphatase
VTGPEPTAAASSSAGLLQTVAAIDDRIDKWFEPLRGTPVVDATAKLISAVGDHGWLWTGVAVWRGRRSGPTRRAAIRALGVAGISSTLVNTGLKLVVQRERPDASDLELSATGVPVRAPRTSSFPSGHTLAAFCSAAVLSRPGERAGNAALYASAGLIGASRIHLGHHHASDVMGGVVIGTALGLVVRRLR